VSPDRDRLIEQAVTHELRGRAAARGEACIDAEALAAWTDGTLDAVTVAAMEAHVSSCARCQELIGVMARTVPASPVSTTQGSEARRLAWWKWLVPISAAAAATVIWMVVPGQRQLAVAPAQPSAADAPAQDTLTALRPDSPQPASPAALPSEARANKVTPAKPPPALAKEKDQKLAGTMTADRDQPLDKSALKAEQAVVANEAPAMASPPPTAPATAPAAAPAARQEAFATRSMDQQAQRVASVGVDVAAPDARRRWRVLADSIERTDDGGSSWTTVHLLRGASIAGGSSPASTVCWLVGPNGVVILTVDASLFTHVDVPGRPDLRSVTATDARSAVVTASDGRRFRTDDSGRTWREN
jgi:hypothetical protein